MPLPLSHLSVHDVYTKVIFPEICNIIY
uniref:Uncharacterized protein n=1 Tax=Arundo donax TaxID=35708 RepID=A0A0A9HZR6_ARUDO